MNATLLRQLTGILCFGSVMAIAGCTAPRPIESIRTSGDFEFSRGEYARAAAEYREITQRYPGDWRAQQQLGLASLKINEPSQARQALEVALSLRPTDDEIAEALAEAMFLQDDRNQLYAFLRERAEAQHRPRFYLKLAHYALALGDADSALTAAETAILLDDGQSTEPYLAAYAVSQRTGDMDQAVRRLRQAYRINPEDRRVIQRLDDLGEIRGPTLGLPPGR